MIQCSISNVTYPQCIGMAASMGHFYCQAERKGKDMPFRMRDHDSPAIRRSTGTGDRDSDCSRTYFKDKTEVEYDFGRKYREKS